MHIYLTLGLSFLIATVPIQSITAQAETIGSYKSFIKGIEYGPLLLSNDDPYNNSLQGSVYELLQRAQSSILIFSFTFSDAKVIQIINQKACAGVKVQLIIDRDHICDSKGQLDSSIKISTRKQGEGHVHHKILVVDNTYVWLSSANFTPGSFTISKNLAVGFFSPEIAAQMHQEALHIALSKPRTHVTDLSHVYGNQLLELYILPHNAPEAPHAVETEMNEKGRKKLISLINNAKHHIKICVDVWTYKDAAQVIINAVRRGVQVDIIVGDITGEAVKMMMQNGIKVKQGKGVHYKFMLVDHTTLLNGSPNWSMNAFSRSDESFIVLYNLTKEQLNVMEEVLVAAGLPSSMHFNKIAESSEAINAVSNEDIDQKIELVKKTIAALNVEIGKKITGQENKRLIAIAKRLSADLVNFIPSLKTAPVPGCCFYKGNNYLANVVAIAEKQERIEAAINYIKNTGGVDQKVSDYFEKTLHKLQSGINTPLPDYFHATRTGLENIIASKVIAQSATGVTGPGTYISCNNEGDHGYGNYTFAIDEGCLVDSVGTFRTGRHPITNVFFSLWASVLMDIPINENTIAFIDTSVGDISYVKELLKKQNLDIDVLDRKTSDSILRIIDLTTKRRELPSFFWKKFNPQDYLPQNMYPRSLEGTFRRFMFTS